MEIRYILEAWVEFIEEWKKNPENIQEYEGETRLIKPQFYDFMKWLAKDIKPKSGEAGAINYPEENNQKK